MANDENKPTADPRVEWRHHFCCSPLLAKKKKATSAFQIENRCVLVNLFPIFNTDLFSTENNKNITKKITICPTSSILLGFFQIK